MVNVNDIKNGMTIEVDGNINGYNEVVAIIKGGIGALEVDTKEEK